MLYSDPGNSMHFDNQVIILLRNLVSQGGLILFFAFLLTRIRGLKRMVLATSPRPREIIVLLLFFSGIGILGTYTGIPIMGALANARVVGVFVGGLLGGPLVGIAAGILAGFHRWSIDIGGFTSVACMVSTITEGLIAGFLSPRFRRAENKWLFAARWGATAELVQMLLILLIARPFCRSPAACPDNSRSHGSGKRRGHRYVHRGFGGCLPRRRTYRRQAVAPGPGNRTGDYRIPAFRIHNRRRAAIAASIILKNLKVSAVSLTDREKCLAHKGRRREPS